MATYRNRHTGQIKQSLFPMGYPWEKVVVQAAPPRAAMPRPVYSRPVTVVEEVYVEPSYGYSDGFVEGMIIADAIDAVADTFGGFADSFSDFGDTFSGGGGDFGGGGADFDW